MKTKTRILAIGLLLLSGMVAIISSCSKDDAEPAELSNLIVKTAPLKTNYVVGDVLDLTGLVITLNMNDGTTKDVAFSGFINEGITCSPANESVVEIATTNIQITHTTTGIKVNQSISIEEVMVSKMTVKTEPLTTDFYFNELLDISGLEVTITMNNGETEDIAFSDFTSKGISCSPANETTLDSQTEITITHTATSTRAIQLIEVGTTSDYDGNTYNIVKIADQVWMAENLRATHYADGSEITLVEDNTTWSNLTETDIAYCYHDNNSANADTYGALYTWSAAMNSAISSETNPSNVQGACPDGWHLPSDSEWTELTDYIADETNAGTKLKSTNGWYSDGNGTDNYSFAALPGSFRYYYGVFGRITEEGYWWSCTENESEVSLAYIRSLGYNHPSVKQIPSLPKNDAFSVRCVRN